MDLLDTIREAMHWASSRRDEPMVEERILDVPSGSNYRDLGGYDTPWGPTRYGRFVRAGSTSSLTTFDLNRLERYGVCRVLDLRSEFEAPHESDRFARRKGIDWLNVPLFDYDLSDPKLLAGRAPTGNYLIGGYVNMLSNRDAIRRIFEFFAETPAGGAVLFHCAAGMDRTGMVALLLLGLADVPHRQIVADYLYSFALPEEVDSVVFDGMEPQVHPGGWNPLVSRREAVEFVLSGLEEGYGTVRAYLETCGVGADSLDAVRGMLVGSN